MNRMKLNEILINMFRRKLKNELLIFIQIQKEKTEKRLNNLYDMKIDKEISDELFQKKEQEYRNPLIDITY